MKKRRVLVGMALAGLGLSTIFLILVASTPVSRTATRAAVVIAAIAPIISLLALLSPYKRAVSLAAAGMLLLMSWLLFYSPDTSRQGLGNLYLRRLVSYEGTPYSWGGESHRGIDCSGLPRRSLIEALLFHGAQTLNPTLIRYGVWLWWHDASARSLRDGYLAQTVSITSDDSINTSDLSRLAGGDMAVTQDGIHLLVYLGDRRWLEAEPGEGRVVVHDSPDESHHWFTVPVDFIRWSIFKEGSI